MNRRSFLRGAGAACAVAPFARPVRGRGRAGAVAITIDDFDLTDHERLTGVERHRRLLEHLDAHGVKAAGFVVGKNADSPEHLPLVEEWSKHGHVVGNHTYRHPYYPDTPLADFTADIEHCESVISKVPTFEKLFRFPYLKEGDTATQRDAMRRYLHANGYRNGHVTIDASDWYVDSRMRTRLKDRPDADLSPYRDYYLAHIVDRARYYDGLSRAVLGRAIPHTLLLHHNVLNGLFLGDLLDAFKRVGWALVDAREAFADRVFQREPAIAPAGESLVWALAKESGKFAKSLRYPGESDEYEKPKMDALGL